MKKLLLIASLTAGIVYWYKKKCVLQEQLDDIKIGGSGVTIPPKKIDLGRLSTKRFNMINYRPKSNHENQL